MIVDYVTDGDDFQYSDNHGVLIRCRDCKFWQDQEHGVIEVPICARPQKKDEKLPFVMMIDGNGYCSFAERKEYE